MLSYALFVSKFAQPVLIKALYKHIPYRTFPSYAYEILAIEIIMSSDPFRPASLLFIMDSRTKCSYVTRTLTLGFLTVDPP